MSKATAPESLGDAITNIKAISNKTEIGTVVAVHALRCLDISL